MGDAPNLDDFFDRKKKKKIKGTNLNNAATNAKTEEKQPKTKSQEEEEWQEEQVVATTIQVAAPGRIIRDEDSKPEEDEPKKAWGNAKGKTEPVRQTHNDKKNPTPAMSVQSSSNINIDDGSEPKVNIKTSINKFSALEDHQDDDEEAANRRPKEIKPVMVQKQKGEREKDAIQREVEKFGVVKKDDGKKLEGKKRKEDSKKKKDVDGGDDGGDEDDDEEGAEVEGTEVEGAEDAATEEPKNNKDDRKEVKKAKEPEKIEPEIPVDLIASKEKYQGRQRLPLKELPPEEYEERTMKNKPIVVNRSKKKGANVDFDKKRILAELSEEDK